MDVFISWSGNVSRQVAESLGSFVQHVVSGATTFVSTQDIDIGEPWDSRLNLELARTNHAILCLTRDNQGAPWINYEAGALGKLLTRNRVIPYTIGFPPNELAAGSPLSRFQGVRNDEHGTWKLVNALNAASVRPKPERFVKEGFAMFWPELQKTMLEAEATPRSPDDSNPSDRELLLEMRESLNKLLNQTTASARVGAAVDMLEDLYIDPLTRLPNVRSLMTEAARLDANSVSYVLAIIDLNEFKRINDSFGHHTGDRVLAFVASRLKDHIPSAGTVARYAGDEFVVVMSGDTSPTKLAETLTDVFPIISRSAGQAGLPDVTLTAGVSTDRLESFEEKLRDADRAMYEAKKGGGNAVKLA